VRRRSLLLVLGIVLLASCAESSRVDPDAVVTVGGQVRDAAGAPLADRPVRLASGIGAGDAALAFFTLGLACTADVCGEDVATTTTDSTGAYELEVRGRDTQTALGGVRPQALSVAAAPRESEVSGASVTAAFVVQTTAVLLPALQLVDPSLSLGSSASTVGASWETAAGGPYTLTYEDESGVTVPVWEVTTGGSSATVDKRVLEGTRGRAVLSGGSTDQIEGSEVRIIWRSPGVGYASAAGGPASRGRPCRGEAGEAEDRECGLTDGDLASPAVLASSCPEAAPGSPAPVCPAPTAAVVSLSPEEPSELVVVRGCVGSCAIEVSRDGRTFTRAGVATSPYAAVRLPAAPLAAVRVGLGDEGLREVSVWGPAEAEPALQPLTGGALDDVRAPFAGGGGGGGLSPLLIGVAVGLVTLLLLGIGFVLGRRGRRGLAS
jgi:hypothetical protein